MQTKITDVVITMTLMFNWWSFEHWSVNKRKKISLENKNFK